MATTAPAGSTGGVAADPVTAIANAAGEIFKTFQAGFNIISGRDADLTARNNREVFDKQLWAATYGQRTTAIFGSRKTQLITSISAILFLLVITLVLIHKHR